MSSPVDTPTNPFQDPGMADERRPSEAIISSAEASQPGSAGGRPKKKKRVGFGGSDSTEQSPQISWIEPTDGTVSPRSQPLFASPEESRRNTPQHTRYGSLEWPGPNLSKSHLPPLSPQQTLEIHEAMAHNLPRPRPAMRRGISTQGNVADEELEGPDEVGDRPHRQARMHDAHVRAKRFEQEERSGDNSRYTSPERNRGRHVGDFGAEDIPLENLGGRYDGQVSDEEEGLEMKRSKRRKALPHDEAHRLVRKHTTAREVMQEDASPSGFRSGAVTPTKEQEYAHDYRPRPEQYRGGILGSLLKLYKDDRENQGGHSRSSSMAQSVSRRQDSADVSATSTPQHSPPASGTATPNGHTSNKSWFSWNRRSQSTSSLTHLIGSSSGLGTPVVAGLGEQVTQKFKERKENGKRPAMGPKSYSSSALAALNRVKRGRRNEDQIKITVHIAETIARQKYLQLICRALMQYGAPTHRLEEYMKMTSRVLEIEAQFLYIPGSMIMSFDDSETHTTEVKLVKVAQALDLGKLRDVHDVYKEVVHDLIGVEEATGRLNEVIARKDKYSRWIRIPVYGLAAASVGPFAFQARLIDLPIAFILGCILGFLQLVVAPRSDLFANVFEVSAAVLTSFLARLIGSINGGTLFCFSALAQSSIALILPGYIVLCASLELQSKSLVAGSVRMVYAVIYTLFLGYGITIGTAIYGIIDKNATSEAQCRDPIPNYWFFFFVPLFTMCLIVINQAKWKQAPVMLVIAFIGYLVNFFSAQRFAGNTQVSNTLGAFAIGVMAHLYSRNGSSVENWALDRWEHQFRPLWRRFRKHVFHTQSNTKSAKRLEEGSARDDESLYTRAGRRVGFSLAAAAMLPAIFVQVPSGLAVQGSLVSGIASANQISGNATNGTTVVNSTTLASGSTHGVNSVAFNVSFSVIQVAIGITVGLFLSAIVMYPRGKKRSGLFSL